MRSALFLASSLTALALAAACASAEDEDPRSNPDTPPAPSTPDAPKVDGGSEPADSAVEIPRCSSAGWCRTELPGTDLVLRDIVPFATRAFAVAESATLGVKVLEWEAATDTWKYIDDEVQGAFGLGTSAGKMWAPNENEVYFTIAPSFVYRGTRSAPGETWSWTGDRLSDNLTGAAHTGHDHGFPTYAVIGTVPALGVWGTGADDVYAWYSNTVFRRASTDGGAPAWVAEYVADDVDLVEEHLYILALGGARDAVWFAGARTQATTGCPMLARRTAHETIRIVDHVVDSFGAAPCAPRTGTHSLDESAGWLTDLQLLDDGTLFALKNAHDLVALTPSGSDFALRTIPLPLLGMNFEPQALYSMWFASKEVWLSGYSHIVRGDTSDLDAGNFAFAVSTVSTTNLPLGVPLYRVRGTSGTNLWAVGAGYALHKTTP